MGKPPVPTLGDPSTSPDVTASMMMQNVSTEEDSEWFEELFRKMHARFLDPTRNTVQNGMDQGLSCGAQHPGEQMSESLRKFITLCLTEKRSKKKKGKLVTEPDDVDKKDRKPKTKEVNSIAGGNIRGYTSPLAGKKIRRKNANVNARAFGGGKVVGKLI